jgi:hypothetical protein
MNMRKFGLFFVLAAALPGFGQTWTAGPLANPAPAGSLQPNWSVAPDGSAVLSWIEPAKDGSYTLRYAIHRASGWSEARTVAAQRHFFRHPAEVPEVEALTGQLWMAHWVEMPNEKDEAEYVYASSSTDGMHWTAPLMAHQDHSAVQHGLASMIASGNGEASIFWLETPQGEDGPGYLMRTIVNAQGKEVREERLDPDVCSCCPTAVAKTPKGLLVAYRAHTPQDIRDISVIRFENGKWSPSKNVYPDNWKLNACPTNAAAVATKGDRVAVSWFTASHDLPRVEIAFSSDDGAAFSKPVVVSTGRAFGYTSLVMDENGNAIVSWLEEGGNNARVLAREVTAAGAPGPVVKIAEGGRMALGYPKLFHSGNETLIAWGSAREGSKLETARLKK